MGLWATYEATCDAKGCDAVVDLGLGDERGARIVANEQGWQINQTGATLCPSCRGGNTTTAPPMRQGETIDAYHRRIGLKR